MHREWKHSVSEVWLLARQPYLTASEILGLIPEYKKIKKGKVELFRSPVFARLYGEKQSLDVDPESRGSAARGHVLEPYAIEEANRIIGEQRFHWWDDRIITAKPLGFSPDALNVPPMKGTRILSDNCKLIAASEESPGPASMLEVKCYLAGKHYQCKLAASYGKMLDERWQVACGMAVCPSISEGWLMFYAPQCRDAFMQRYSRIDLVEEIEIVREIAEIWSSFEEHMDSLPSQPPAMTEDQIYREYMMTELMG